MKMQWLLCFQDTYGEERRGVVSQEPHSTRCLRVAGDQPEGAEDYHAD